MILEWTLVQQLVAVLLESEVLGELHLKVGGMLGKGTVARGREHDDGYNYVNRAQQCVIAREEISVSTFLGT